MKIKSAIALIVTVGLGSTTWGQQINPVPDDESQPSVTEAARQALTAQYPRVRFYDDGARTTRVYGTAFGFGASAEESADLFRLQFAEMFGVEPEDLDPRGPLADGRHTQPLMYDRAADTYMFTLVYFTQHENGIPVFRADVRLLTRNQPDHPLVLAASALRDLQGFSIDPVMRNNLDDGEFVAAAFAAGRASALTAFPTLVNFTEPQVVVWAGVDDMVVAPRTAVTFTGDDTVLANGPADTKWLFVTDITTGEILYQENQILEVDVAGNVSGNATEGSGAEQCENEVLTPMPYARVNIGGTIAYADENGDFVIPNAGSSDVTVETGPRGLYFRVFEQPTGGETVLSSVVTPPGPANFVQNGLNTESTRAEVNAYINGNIVRDFALNVNPAYPVIGGQSEFSMTVNEGATGFCPGNAQYQGNNLRFCAAGSGSPNTAWSSVVYHEYGHHLVSVGGSGQGQYGEGTGDSISILILDESGIGFGFFGAGTCNTPLRESDNTRQYPCSGEVHDCGELMAACVWHTRNALAASYPATYREILSNLALNAILLHSGSTITPQITIDWLTLDDDDANLDNGTPHYPEICDGFGQHSMDCPAIQVLAFDYPTGLPDLVTPNETTIIPVNVSSVTADPIPGTGVLHYRVGTTGSFSGQFMNQPTPNNYLAELPAVDCPETIQYYFSASALGMGIINDPDDAPATTYATVASSGTVTVISHDFETNPGWSVSGTAVDGPWDRGVPVDCDRGDPPADYDGSGQCWLTDNSSANACNSDVDNGATTLTSELMDLGALANPHVTYARWFSNNTGDGPETDTLVVQISTNGGGTWTNLETVGPTSGSPNGEVSGGWFVKTYPVPASSQFMIRFRVEDVDPQSIVEAGVDAYMVFDYECPACPAATGDLNGVDGTNGADIQLFVNGILGAPTQAEICAGDFNGNSGLDTGDINGMVSALLLP